MIDDIQGDGLDKGSKDGGSRYSVRNGYVLVLTGAEHEGKSKRRRYLKKVEKGRRTFCEMY